MTRSRRDERGAATVLTVAMLGVLLLVGSVTGMVGALVVDHRQAQAAADLAALAGAAAHTDHTGRDPCVTAAGVAEANGATLRSCVVEGADVVVEVVVTGPQWLGRSDDLVGRARAGPADAPAARPAE